jgi:hypothetical protein
MTNVRTALASIVSGEYDVILGRVMVEVKAAHGVLAVFELDTRQARELQLVLNELLGPPLGTVDTDQPGPDGAVPYDVKKVTFTFDASRQFIESMGGPPAAATEGPSS